MATKTPVRPALDRAGVVVRARRIQGRVGDSVIKLRPLDPDEVGKDVRILSGFGVEVDAIPGGFVCSSSSPPSSQPTEHAGEPK